MSLLGINLSKNLYSRTYFLLKFTIFSLKISLERFVRCVENSISDVVKKKRKSIVRI